MVVALNRIGIVAVEKGRQTSKKYRKWTDLGKQINEEVKEGESGLKPWFLV